MSDQPNPAVQPQQPPIVVVSAADLVEEMIRRIPSLAQVKDELTQVFGIYVQFVNSPTGQLPLEDALADLEAFYSTDQEGVRRSVVAINRVIAQESVAITAEFKDMTGVELDPKTLAIEEVVDAEVTEQRELDKLARDFLAAVQAIVTKLGVRDLYAEKKQASNMPEKKGLFAGVQTWALQKGLVSVQDPEDLVSEPEPDWLTPAIISMENPDVVRVKAKLDAIARQMARYAAQPNMKALVLAALENLSMPVVELERLLEHACDLAYGQIEQSTTILAGVGEDQKALEERIDAVNDVKNIYGAVLRYFSGN